MNRPESNAVFRVLKHGLVLIEHQADRDCFMVIRPASLAGSVFRGCDGQYNVSMSSASVPTNAPPAMLRITDSGWLVDISVAASGPKPSPTWFHAEFDTCKDAVDAIIDCFFGDRVDNYNDTLVGFYGDDREP